MISQFGSGFVLPKMVSHGMPMAEPSSSFPLHTHCHPSHIAILEGEHLKSCIPQNLSGSNLLKLPEKWLKPTKTLRKLLKPTKTARQMVKTY